MKKISLVLIVICPILLISQSIKGFKTPDSLREKNFNQLKDKYNKTINSKNDLAELYANCIVVKAKQEKKYLDLIAGYKSLHFLKSDKSALFYLDSIIIVAKKINAGGLIADAFMHKGNYYYLKGRYTDALAFYLKSQKHIKTDSNTYQTINFNIGLLKLELGNYKEAQNLFFNYKKYLENNNLANYIDYLSCLYAIAYTYNKMNYIDLSESYIRRGLKANEQVKNEEIYSYLLLVSGINSYKKKDFNVAIKKLRITSKIIQESHYNDQNLAISEFYIGKILNENNNIKFVDKFKKVDSILMKSKNITLELREVYPPLIEHYKKNNDKENQLIYIEHLLTIDGILNENKYILSNTINKNYDTPNLLSEKQKLISDLDSQNLKLFLGIVVMGLISGFLIFIYMRNLRNIRFYKKQAEILIKESKNINLENRISKDETIANNISNLKSNLPQDIIESLRPKFLNFEKEKKYLDRKLTLDALAKEFKTNRDYLSKGVNELKGKNFSQYINELRINYIVNQLKDNPSLQKYTIAGIAEEAGYNHSESFTNAFKKITGTLPSYYIRALQEKK